MFIPSLFFQFRPPFPTCRTPSGRSPGLLTALRMASVLGRLPRRSNADSEMSIGRKHSRRRLSLTHLLTSSKICTPRLDKKNPPPPCLLSAKQRALVGSWKLWRSNIRAGTNRSSIPLHQRRCRGPQGFLEGAAL